MRNRILILLAAFSLIFAAPLLAQTEEPQPQDETQVEQDVETQANLQADAEDGTASASAELTSETQGEMESDVQAEADAEAGISTEDDRELPQTAGFLPLLALLGLGSLAAALSLRATRK